jgi:hypothetical protein
MAKIVNCKPETVNFWHRNIVHWVLLFISMTASAQQNIKDTTIHIFMLSPTFAYQVPGGDLANRFGNNLSIGGSFSYKSQTNWIIGLDGNFIFGGTIYEPGLFNGISTSQGYIIGTGGIYADIRTYERGYHFNLKVGKLIPKWGPNKNSGPLFTVGGGFLQHKIRIENPSNDAPQLTGDYTAGYDRRTNGFAITEFAGYQYLGNKGKVNFFAGFEFVQAFTQNRRSLNFDTMKHDDTKRLDLLSGIRVGWIFTMYRRKPQEVYYN